MLVRILNTLRSRIWDMVLFLFLRFGFAWNECNSLWRDGEKSEDYCFLGSSIIPKIIFFNEWDKNAGAFTNLLFVIKTRNLNVNPLEFNFSESCSLLVHSMLPNCRFRLDRKRNTALSQMRLRSVFKMRMSILNTATTEQMG